MGGLLHFVQRGGAWVGRGSLLAVPNVAVHLIKGLRAVCGLTFYESARLRIRLWLITAYSVIDPETCRYNERRKQFIQEMFLTVHTRHD